MSHFIKGIMLVCLTIGLLFITWFGIGSWMRSQPSNILYYGGTILDILVIIPSIYLGKSAVNNLTMGAKE